MMNQNESAAKWIARWVAVISLFLIPITPLIVANGYFFPFISGKAFFFRILVEIAVCAWVVLALLDKEYRPRFSWVGGAVLAFVIWMFVADMFALNVAKAFWSNFERMEGWVLLVHLLGLFFVAGSVLRVEKKWRAWFLTSLVVAVVVSIYAFIQLGGGAQIHQGAARLDATLGNSAYLAIYFFFNVCIALWLAATEKISEIRWFLVLFAVIEAILIFFTQTRGTVLALIGGLTLAALLTAVTAGKKARSVAVGGLVLLAVLVGGVYLARNTSFVQNNSVLQRITSVSAADGQTRFTLWGMALQGVSERPIVGWGQEGFNYVFNKYYDPSLYQQESWFDRAHNTFVDWLIAGGIPGFVLYLALFVITITMLWRSAELSRSERIILTSALVGYAIHNLFVFDNLYSYVYFFAILALVDSQVARPCKLIEDVPVINAEDGMVYALPLATGVALVLIWTVNVPGMQVANKLITALTPLTAGIEEDTPTDIAQKNVASNLAKSMTAFEDITKNPSFAGQEIREQLANYASSVAQSSLVSNEDKKTVTSLAISEMQKQVAAYPLDARAHLELSYAYRAGRDGVNALKEMLVAGTLSPKKESLQIEEGVLEWDLGDVQATQKYFAEAYKLGPQFPDLATYAAAGSFAIGDIATADNILLTTYGTTTVDKDVLAVAYYRTKDWPRLVEIWKLRVSSPSASVQTWFGLASAYYAAGDRSSAINTLKSVLVLHPEAAQSVQGAIAQIESGK